MTVKHTLVSSDMRVFALCSLMEFYRNIKERYFVMKKRDRENIDKIVPIKRSKDMKGRSFPKLCRYVIEDMF